MGLIVSIPTLLGSYGYSSGMSKFATNMNKKSTNENQEFTPQPLTEIELAISQDAESENQDCALVHYNKPEGGFVKQIPESIAEDSRTNFRKEMSSDNEKVSIWEFRNIGFIMQYFSVGLILGGLPATTYGLLLGYLNVPGYVYSTASVISTLPWSFKFFFGMMNDCFPIFGYRRKSYMVLGWIMCCAVQNSFVHSLTYSHKFHMHRC